MTAASQEPSSQPGRGLCGAKVAVMIDAPLAKSSPHIPAVRPGRRAGATPRGLAVHLSLRGAVPGRGNVDAGLARAGAGHARRKAVRRRRGGAGARYRHAVGTRRLVLHFRRQTGGRQFVAATVLDRLILVRLVLVPTALAGVFQKMMLVFAVLDSTLALVGWHLLRLRN